VDDGNRTRDNRSHNPIVPRTEQPAKHVSRGGLSSGTSVTSAASCYAGTEPARSVLRPGCGRLRPDRGGLHAARELQYPRP
jgi:hypothetical protein